MPRTRIGNPLSAASRPKKRESLRFLWVSLLSAGTFLFLFRIHSQLWSYDGDFPTNDQVNRILSSSIVINACEGKERFLKVLVQSGFPENEITEDLCQSLPSEAQVAELYGLHPIVDGLDRCEEYSSALKAHGNLAPQVRVTGLFNTGTNAFSVAVYLNLRDAMQLEGNYSQIQAQAEVPWKKHWPTEARSHWVDNTDPKLVQQIMPVVLIRDPFRWMQSMCKARYITKWKKGVQKHCPNLVPNDREKSRRFLQNGTTFEVKAAFGDDYDRKYATLADFWSQWNLEFFEANFPRLFVRFEDTLFYPEETMQIIGNCLGLPAADTYRSMVRAAKEHGKSSSLISAMIKYGSPDGRTSGMQPGDITYSRTSLDGGMMKRFHYPGA